MSGYSLAKDTFGFGFVYPDRVQQNAGSYYDWKRGDAILDAVQLGIDVTRQVTQGSGTPNYSIARASISASVDKTYTTNKEIINAVSATAGLFGLGGFGNTLAAASINEKAAIIHNAKVGSLIYEYVEKNHKNLPEADKVAIREALTAYAYNIGKLYTTYGDANQQSGTVPLTHDDNKGTQNRIYPKSAKALAYYRKLTSRQMQIPSFKVSSSLSTNTENIANSTTQLPILASAKSELNNKQQDGNSIRERAAAIEAQLKIKTAQNTSRQTTGVKM
jgi:hypothetical protein